MHANTETFEWAMFRNDAIIDQEISTSKKEVCVTFKNGYRQTSFQSLQLPSKEQQRQTDAVNQQGRYSFNRPASWNFVYSFVLFRQS